MKIVISSGHGLHIRGASGVLDEVDEARRVVERVAQFVRRLGSEATTFHDDYSTEQSENLETIVDFHNDQERDLDVSVHFNAYVETEKPMGTEVLYTSDPTLASHVAEAIADVSGLINRGPKDRDDLYFLNQTEEKAILIETCFVDSTADAEIYNANFDRICAAIAVRIVGVSPLISAVTFSGKVSHFGGPHDTGVDPDEGLAFFYEVDDAPHLFLPEQPAGTTGLARRLDPDEFYVACRWDYDVTPKTMLADATLKARVHAPKTGKTFLAWPADWGPHSDTGRAADISPGLMAALGITTDDEVEIIYPAKRRES